MIGGIYCEASLGPIFDNGVIMSVRQGMQRLFGEKEIIPRGETLSEQIINYWYEDVSKRMSKILSSWKVPTNRGYYNRTSDLTRSICLGVYHNGKLKRTYRFTGGQQHEKYTQSEMGSGTSYGDTVHLQYMGATKHPNPAARAREFLEGYDLIHKKDFTVVIAATMPYAVRLEYSGQFGNNSGGYALPVLRLVVNRMLSGIYDFKKGNKSGVFYGYVFENGGRFEA